MGILSQLNEVFWGVVSTFAAFLAGLGWRRVIQVTVNFRARRFWRPVVAGGSSIVVGSFGDRPEFEASGLIGVGDAFGLSTLERHFAKLGYQDFVVHYSDHIEWGTSVDRSPLSGNLILLGGPDSNTVTRLVLERVVLGIEFVEIAVRPEAEPSGAAGSRIRPRRQPRLPTRRSGQVQPTWRVPAVRDKENDRTYSPTKGETGLARDCGIVIRCPNPFNPDRQVAIICGSYGYGTWAAAQHIQRRDFLAALPKRAVAIECVLSTEIIAGKPQNTWVELLRSVDDPLPADPGSAATVPRIVHQ